MTERRKRMTDTEAKADLEKDSKMVKKMLANLGPIRNFGDAPKYTDEGKAIKDGLPPKTRNYRASETQVGGAHYKDMAIQPSEFIQKNGLNWCEANVVKYVCRHRAKNGAEDIKKAIHYLTLLLEWKYGGTE